MAVPRKVTIDIVSDVICPWCFVGKRRLERALALPRCADVQATVTWRPFNLDPGLPAAGESKIGRYNAKFGASRVTSMLSSMAEVGREVGIAFDFGGLIANTTPAHALLEAALEQGGPVLQGKVQEGLFSYYFEKAGNLGDLAAIAAVAEAAGMTNAANVLADKTRLAKVAHEIATWGSRYRVSGVPFFILSDGRRSITLSGAQEPETIADAIESLVGESKGW